MLDVGDKEVDLTETYEAYDDVAEAEDDAFAPYRSVSRAAVMSVLLAVFSLAGLLFPMLLALAVIGIFLGLLARRNLRRYPEELSGGGVASFGTAACVVLLAGGVAMHTYIYMTEVPDGYQRISFGDLQPKEETSSAEDPGLPVELDGKRVFIKGYVHPGVSSVGVVKKFILVPDMGTCCFGGQPKLADMVEVTIVDAPGLRYNRRKRKLGGIFKVQNTVPKMVGGIQSGFYELRADYVK